MMAGTCEDALGALSARLGLPLRLDDGSCEFEIDGLVFVVRREDELDRMVVSALVADDLPDAPSRRLTADLLNLGFGMMQEGLPAVGRDPETGFIAAFAIFPYSRLVAAEFPDAFEKFVAFAMRLADRLEAENSLDSQTAEANASFDPNAFLPV